MVNVLPDAYPRTCEIDRWPDYRAIMALETGRENQLVMHLYNKDENVDVLSSGFNRFPLVMIESY